MAVTIVRTATTSQQALNPTVKLNPVAANDTLLVFSLEADQHVPGAPSDTGNDAFSIIDSNWQGNLNVAFSLYYSLRSAGGNQTISVPTQAASRLVALQLAGVATPAQSLNRFGHTVWNPDVPDGIFDTQAFSADAGGSIGTAAPNGALIFAIVMAAGSPTITFNSTGWTPAASGSQFGLTYDIQTISVPGPTNLSAHWTLSVPSSYIVEIVGMPAA